MSCHVMPCHVVSCHVVMSCHIMSCHVMSGEIVLVSSPEEAVRVSDRYAAEHLEVQVEEGSLDW